MFTIFCDLIGRILNNVSDLIGAKTTKGKECCLNVSSRLWGGALRDDTKNGYEGDYRGQKYLCEFVYDLCEFIHNLSLSKITSYNTYTTLLLGLRLSASFT